MGDVIALFDGPDPEFVEWLMDYLEGGALELEEEVNAMVLAHSWQEAWDHMEKIKEMVRAWPE